MIKAIKPGFMQILNPGLSEPGRAVNIDLVPGQAYQLAGDLTFSVEFPRQINREAFTDPRDWSMLVILDHPRLPEKLQVMRPGHILDVTQYAGVVLWPVAVDLSLPLRRFGGFAFGWCRWMRRQAWTGGGGHEAAQPVDPLAVGLAPGPFAGSRGTIYRHSYVCTWQLSFCQRCGKELLDRGFDDLDYPPEDWDPTLEYYED